MTGIMVVPAIVALALALMSAIAGMILADEPYPPVTREQGEAAVPLPVAAPDAMTAERERLLIAHVHLSLYARRWAVAA